MFVLLAGDMAQRETFDCAVKSPASDITYSKGNVVKSY